MKKYLVTGAAGFIGSALAQKLVERGHRVWTIDNLSTGYEENIPKAVEFVRGDCQDAAVIKQLKNEKFDAILHIAGQSSGEISFDDPSYDLRTNTESTLRLIKYGLETGCQRFVYASSMSVYGAVEDCPIAETHLATPLSFYGIGKLASEHYMRIYQSRGLNATALRYFNVYGPNQNMSNLRQGMVSIFLAQLLKNDKVQVKGHLERFRDFIYIDDVVRFTLGVVDDQRAFGGVYNLGTGVKTTVKQLFDTMFEIVGIQKEIVVQAGTPGDQNGIYADMSLVKTHFGFQHEYSLKDGLQKMVDWAKKSNW